MISLIILNSEEANHKLYMKFLDLCSPRNVLNAFYSLHNIQAAQWLNLGQPPLENINADGVHATGSVHARSYTRPTIEMNRNFPEHVSAESP